MTNQIESEEKVEWSQYELVPMGLFSAEIVKIEKVEGPFEKGEFQYQIHFELNHRNSQDEPVVVTRMISRKLSPKSKLFELGTMLLIKSVELGVDPHTFSPKKASILPFARVFSAIKKEPLLSDRDSFL